MKQDNKISYEQNNVFALILRGELPCSKVYEDDSLLAFHDVNPISSVHVLVIPKKPFISFDDFAQNSNPNELAHFFQTIQKIANSFGLAESGYRLVTNHGKDAMQLIPHFHVHILGKTKLDNISS